ncbi:hypothetical protein EJ04DRAFT_578553 [Polyplosphaeria fusca]|uniref:C3H1-type domain-containing protein n=1 Tax=Polyplosphaeria fusca TaxID=682080 RepID=A0A9P4QWI1_9PLEO|nr:hypothetical protein EJ04DRAFT_578553 [Polyplosphaeria fusca]
MLLQQEDQQAFKVWAVDKVKKVTSADPDPVAELVFELLVADEPEDLIRKNALIHLPDLLDDGADVAAFVNGLIEAAKNKSYLPQEKKGATTASASLSPANAPVPSTVAPAIAPSNGTRVVQPQQKQRIPTIDNRTPNGPPTIGRKRLFNEQDPDNGSGERPTKAVARRGGTVSRGGPRGQPRTTHANMPGRGDLIRPDALLSRPSGLGMPLSNAVPAFTGFNGMANPDYAAALGMPSFPPPIVHPSRSIGLGVRNERCRAFDTEGICFLGPLCAFDHSIQQTPRAARNSRGEGEVPGKAAVAIKQADALTSSEHLAPTLDIRRFKGSDISKQLKETEDDIAALNDKIVRAQGVSASDAALIDRLTNLQNEAAKLNQSGGTDSGGYGGSYSSRGAFASRGRFRVPLPGGAVKRLDNRPKVISVAGVAAGSQVDEALRQQLVMSPFSAVIESHPTEPNTQTLRFHHRYEAEAFIDIIRKSSELTTVKLAWVPNKTPATMTALAQVDPDEEQQDKSMISKDEEPEEDADTKVSTNGHHKKTIYSPDDMVADFDVAEDDEWL